MPTLNIGGRRVTVDDSFLKLSPEQQNATVDEISASFGASFNERFQPMQSPAQEQSKATSIALDYMNQGSAAGQRTTPNIQAQMPNLISADTHENDAGELLFRDPKSGQLVPTDQNKHVALRDPADNRIKVFARTADTDEGRLSAAGRLLSTGMAAGAPTARPAIPKPTAAQITPKASDIIATAKQHYRAFEQTASRIEVPTETASGLAERVRGALQKANFIPELAKPVYAAVDILEGGGVQSIADLQNVKRVIGRSFSSPDKAVRDAASVASAEISKIIGEVSPEAAKSIKTADQIFAAGKSLQELQRKSDVADLRAGRAGYGGNAVNSMRQVLSSIVQRAVEGKTTGFKPDELRAMREIVEGTPAINTARLVGQLSPTKGILPTMGSGSAAIATGSAIGAGPAVAVGLAIPALGASANKIATIMTVRQIERLKDLVARRSPAYAEAVKRSIKRYEDAQMKLASEPTPGRLAGYISASRALSSGLNRDGISISSGDLMRAIQGPMRSSAEDE